MTPQDALAICYGGIELAGDLPAGTVEQLQTKIPGAASQAPAGIGGGGVADRRGSVPSASLSPRLDYMQERSPSSRRYLMRALTRYGTACAHYGAVLRRDMLGHPGVRPSRKEIDTARFWTNAWNQLACKAQGLPVTRKEEI